MLALKMSEATVRPHVLTAVHQALDAYELGTVPFYHVKHAAQRIYRDNWKRYRQAAGLWSDDKDGERLNKYPLPSQAAKRVFCDDAEVLRLMVSKDERLGKYRDKLMKISESRDSGSCHEAEIARGFIEFTITQQQGMLQESYPWSVTVGQDEVVTFPGHDTYALWISLKELLRK